MSRILIIDDEILNLKILKEDLADSGYQTVTANNGKEAIDVLKKDQDFNAIMLDRMMPKMNGIEVMHYINSDPRTKNIPVIMQSAAASNDEIKEGMEVGIFHYLTKPFEKETMLQVLEKALTQSGEHGGLKHDIIKGETAFPLMTSCSFEFNTINDAKNIAQLLSNTYKDPDKLAIALQELLLNAIEHGILGISYDEKKKQLEEENWESFLALKMSNPSFRERKACVDLERTKKRLKIIVKDEGDGFNFQDFELVNKERMYDPNGRGILTAKSIFNSVTYKGKGNEVECVIDL